MYRSTMIERGASQAGVDGFGLQGQDGEDAFVDAPEGFAAGDAVQGFQAESVFAQRQRALVAEPALAQAGQVGWFGVVGTVDEAQVLPAAHLQARLDQAAVLAGAATTAGGAGQVRGGL